MATTERLGRAGNAEQYPLPPALLDAEVYRDPAQYAAEMGKIFYKSWFPAFPQCDLAQTRDFVVWDRLGQSIVVVRQDDGSLAAWHNVCQHRGARLVAQSGHCDKGGFSCPWHGFRYGLMGELKFATLKESFDTRRLRGMCIPRIRVEEWCGFVWLNLDEDGPGLRESLGPLWEELGWYGMDKFSVRYRATLDLSGNWKVVVDAFNETWHVPFTHQASLGRLMLWRDARLKIAPPHSWMTLPVAGLTERAGADADHHVANVCHYTVFPNTIFSCFPTHLQMWSAWPVAVDRTMVTAWGIVGPTPAGITEQEWQTQNDRDWEHFMRVTSEDSGVINHLSLLSGSQGIRQLMFNTAESRLTAFHHEVLKIVGGGEKLQIAK